MAAPESAWRVFVGGDAIEAAWDPPAADADALDVFVFAPGAGGHMRDKSVLAMSTALRDRNVGVVRFNFLYRMKGSARPDPMPRLVECWNAVAARAREELHPNRLIVGGRSMGGRAASVAVSEGMACDGVLLLAYPLHPPGQTTKLRVAHLGAIHQPVLCVNGTRDTFCERPLMEMTLASLGTNWQMHWLEGADHGFHVLKKSGTTDAGVVIDAADTCRAWLRDKVPVSGEST
jgi:hypothetical protein